MENTAADVGQAVGKLDPGQGGAAGESTVADGGHAVGQLDPGQGCAAGESTAADGGQTVGQLRRNQGGALIECIVTHSGDPRLHDHRGDLALPGIPGGIAGAPIGHGTIAGDGQHAIDQGPRKILCHIGRLYGRLHRLGGGQRLRGDRFRGDRLCAFGPDRFPGCRSSGHRCGLQCQHQNQQPCGQFDPFFHMIPPFLNG